MQKNDSITFLRLVFNEEKIENDISNKIMMVEILEIRITLKEKKIYFAKETAAVYVKIYFSFLNREKYMYILFPPWPWRPQDRFLGPGFLEQPLQKCS